MMSIHHRLERLESHARPKLQPKKLDLSRKLQRKMNAPLPSGHTPEEFEHAMVLMKAARQLPVHDQSGWMAVQEYAYSLHIKYGSTPPADSQ